MSIIPEDVNYSLTGAGLTAAIAFIYKFFRLLRSDRSSDQINKEESDFREILRTEIKELKETNHKLMIERSELLVRIAALDAKVAYLTEKCDICRLRINQHGS